MKQRQIRKRKVAAFYPVLRQREGIFPHLLAILETVKQNSKTYNSFDPVEVAREVARDCWSMKEEPLIDVLELAIRRHSLPNPWIGDAELEAAWARKI